MLYPGPSPVSSDAHHIKSGGELLFQCLHKTERHLPDLLPFLPVHSLKWMSKGVVSPCLDLYKNNDALFFRDDVDLPENGPVIFPDDAESFIPQKVRGNVFPFLTESIHCPPVSEAVLESLPHL